MCGAIETIGVISSARYYAGGDIAGAMSLPLRISSFPAFFIHLSSLRK